LFPVQDTVLFRILPNGLRVSSGATADRLQSDDAESAIFGTKRRQMQAVGIPFFMSSGQADKMAML